jgi:hypothetical protein
MAYDEDVADRIRRLIGPDPDLTERKMFGGLAFMIRGNMAIAASGEGGAMVRVDPARSDAFVDSTDATVVVMRGRPMPGWLRVGANSDDELVEWVRECLDYARSLPAKGLLLENYGGSRVRALCHGRAQNRGPGAAPG